MAQCNKFLILALLIFLTCSSFARQQDSQNSFRVEYRVPYLRSGSSMDIFGNAVLRELAKDVLREPWLVNIRVSCELQWLVARHDGQERLCISLNHPAVAGDTVFRNFSIAGVLFPSNISMKIKVANRADTSGYVEKYITGEPVTGTGSFTCAIPGSSYNPEVDTLLLSDVRFLYDAVDLKLFMERIDLIHDYYASVSILDSLGEYTAGLQTGEVGMLPLNYLKVQELNRVLERIDARDFPGKLIHNGYDPLDLMRKYHQLFMNSRTMIFNIIDELHKAGPIAWDRNTGRLAAFFTSRVFSYVRRSFLMDQQQGRIYGDCLKHLFDHDAFPPEENTLKILMAGMFPGAVPDTIQRYVSGIIYASYRNSAQLLIEQNQYAEAFSMMENGVSFRDHNPFMQGVATNEPLLSRAAEGICNSYVGIASSCIVGHKYDMAANYLAKAEQYAVEYARYIRSDSILRAVFSELFFLRNADCDQLLGEKKYEEALACYGQFEKAYSAHDLALVKSQLDEKKSLARMGMGSISASLAEAALKHNVSDTALFYYEQATSLRQGGKFREAVDARLDSLGPLMDRYRYERLVKEGAVALEKRQFTLAVSKFKSAKLLAGTSGNGSSKEFDSLYRQAMKNYLIVTLSAAQKKIWASQFDSARDELHKTRSAGFDFGLLEDPDFLAALNNYTRKISDQQCRNLRDSVNFRMIRADRGAALKNFINAFRYYGEALTLGMTDTLCIPGRQAVKDSMSKYLAPSEYQEHESTMNAMIAMGEYEAAVKLQVENQALYKKAGLQRFGLRSNDLHALMAERDNPYLTQAAAGFFLKNNEPRDAFRFLLLLREQHVAAKQVRELQSALGRQLAELDRNGHPGENAAAGLQKYAVENDWFRVFKEAYLSPK